MKRKKAKLEESYTESSPFIVRKPYMQLWQMIFFGFLMTIAIYSSIYFASEQIRNFLVILFGMMIIILFYFVQNTYFDDKTAAEFQSSLYSGAMRSNTMLSFILQQDCTINYFDQRCYQEFNNASRVHDFDHLMETLGIPTKMAEKIADAINNLKFLEFEHKILSGDKRSNVVIGIYPLARPKGFSYLSVYRIKD